MVAASALVSMSAAHAQSAPVAVTVPGIITVSTPPLGAVLVPPVALPGNATGTDAMVVTSNTAYHVTVKADNAKMLPWTGVAYSTPSIGSALSLAPQALLSGPTLTNRTMTTSDQTIISSGGGLANTYTFNFTQPVAAGDPLGLYRTVLTYTVSAGL
jgi:hypothetical protein